MSSINNTINPSTPSINFKAEWTECNKCLNPAVVSLNVKIYRFIKSFVFFIPNAIISKLITWAVFLSSAPWVSDKMKKWSNQFQKFWEFKKETPLYPDSPAHQKLLATYTPIKLDLTTPDGVKIKGHFLKHKDHDTNDKSRVLILLPGRGDCYQAATHTWVLNSLQNSTSDNPIPYSVLVCNLRGTHGLSGTPNQKGLTLDADTLYQFAKSQNIPEDRIDIYGHSLGGGQAVQLKQLHPKTGGKLLIDRSFASLDHEATYFIPKKIMNFGRNLIRSFGWEFNSYKALSQIKDETHIFTHTKDPVIPESHSLGKAILENNPNPDTISVHLYERCHAHPNGYPVNYHSAPLHNMLLKNSHNVEDSEKLFSHILHGDPKPETLQPSNLPVEAPVPSRISNWSTHIKSWFRYSV